MRSPNNLRQTGKMMTGVSPGDSCFFAERQRLWGLAYRMCGTKSDADDVMQDVFLRWQGVDCATIERPEAWLTTVTSRVAIDKLRARKRAEETYVGPWLPEMIPTAIMQDPAELASSLTVGFLLMLERLEPVERVVFLLADIFDEPFVAIAQIVDRSEVACRKIASRARQRLRDPERRKTVTPAQQWQLAGAFAQAVSQGDLEAIHGLLRQDAVLLSDGGAKVYAARHPVAGPERIARFMVNLSKRSVGDGWSILPMPLNGEPGIVMSFEGAVVTAMVVHVTESVDGSLHISDVYVLRNPEKFTALVDR
jgi:RNA polymerase sigma-70 factor, ECF subfamily